MKTSTPHIFFRTYPQKSLGATIIPDVVFGTFPERVCQLANVQQQHLQQLAAGAVATWTQNGRISKVFRRCCGRRTTAETWHTSHESLVAVAADLQQSTAAAAAPHQLAPFELLVRGPA